MKKINNYIYRVHIRGRLLLFLLYSCLNVCAQQEDHKIYTTADGLPHDNVLCVIQDSYGFLWLGTYNGLCRYDGQGFTYYPELVDGKKGGWVNVINVVYEDKDKNIWVGSWDGHVSYYNRKKQSFTHIYIPYDKSTVSCIYDDDEGNIWVGYNNGEIGFVANDTLRLKYKFNDKIYVIKQVEAQGLHVLAGKAIYKYNRYNESYEIVYETSSENLYSSTYVGGAFYSIAHESVEKVVIKSRGKEETLKTSYAEERNITYDKIAVNQKGGIIISDGNKIYTHSQDLELLDSYYVSRNRAFNKNIIINGLIEDNTGIVWIAATTGLIKVDKHRKQFEIYNTNSNDGLLTHNYIRALMVDREHNVWVGYRLGAINKLNYSPDNKFYKNSSVYKLNTSSARLNAEYITNTILQTANGNILFGGQQGVFCLSERNKFQYLLPSDMRTATIEVWALYEDKEGNIWIGTRGNGLFIHDNRENKMYHYFSDTTADNSLSSNNIWKIFGDSKGRVWVGSDGGLDYLYTADSVDHLHFIHHNLHDEDVCNVWSIEENYDGDIWVGTTTSGLYRVSADMTNTERISSIKDKVISSLVVDKHNTVWVFTKSGIYKYFENGAVTHYVEDDGIVSSDFNFNAAAINLNGDVFAGTKIGLVKFNIDRIDNRKPSTTAIRITDMEVAGKNLTGKVYEDSLIELLWKENDITFNLTLTDYATSKYKFRYKLVGNDDIWTYLKTGQNRASYTNIPPGKYRFIAEVDKGKDEWSHTSGFSITIHPAIWQTTWFKVFVVSVLLLICLGLVRWRFNMSLKKQKVRLELEKKIAMAEMDALRSQMNPHFIFNTINSIQGYILDGNDIKANDYLTRFAKLMRLFLESSKSKFVLLDYELELIELYLSLEKLRFEDKFEYEINFDRKILNRNKLIPSLLIQPFLENAIKHGLVHRTTKGKLKIVIEEGGNNINRISILIDDNGIGRKKSAIINSKVRKKHKSRGMEIIRDRIKTFNFIEDNEITIDIIDKELPAQGTIIHMSLPVSTQVRYHDKITNN